MSETTTIVGRMNFSCFYQYAECALFMNSWINCSALSRWNRYHGCGHHLRLRHQCLNRHSSFGSSSSFQRDQSNDRTRLHRRLRNFHQIPPVSCKCNSLK